MKLLRRQPGKRMTGRLLLCAGLLFPALACAANPPDLLRAEDFRHYVDALNQSDPEERRGDPPHKRHPQNRPRAPPNPEAGGVEPPNLPFWGGPGAGGGVA